MILIAYSEQNPVEHKNGTLKPNTMKIITFEYLSSKTKSYITCVISKTQMDITKFYDGIKKKIPILFDFINVSYK